MHPDLYQYTDNIRHKAQLILLAQLGIKVSQLTNLKWADLDFHTKTLSLKTKSAKTMSAVAVLPLSDTACKILAELASQHPPLTRNELLFSHQGKPISRQAVFKMIQKTSEKIPESQQAEIQQATRATSKIIARQQKRKPHFQFLKALLAIFSKKEVSPIISAVKGLSLIGREKEIHRGIACLSDNLSLIITGETGIGKTALLEYLCQLLLQAPSPPRILEIDDCTAFKTSIANLLLYLFDGDKEAVIRLFFAADSKAKLSAKVSKESLSNLCKILVSLTDKHEYLLKIGDIDRITPTAVKALEILAPHFLILTTARDIKLKNATFLWHFERLSLQPLRRLHSFELARCLCSGFQTSDETYLLSRIWDISAGNPKMITELCDKFSRLASVASLDATAIESITSGYLGRQTKEIDMSLGFLLLFGALTIFRFAASEVGNPSLRFIGGIFIIVLLFARPFLSAFKRKNL
jgi:hypothetical protein